jgi:hypothetical protein
LYYILGDLSIVHRAQLQAAFSKMAEAWRLFNGARHNLTAARRLIERASELLAEWDETRGDQPIADSASPD